MKLFEPDKILDKYQDLDIAELKEMGIKYIFMDIDNTLAPYYEAVADDNAKEFIAKLLNADLKIILVSNNKEYRVKTFAESIPLPYHYFSLKPLPFTYNKLVKQHKLSKNEVLCMGDQLLTDVLGARLAGLRVYYTKPLVDKDSFSTKINRKIERIIMRNYQ